MTWSGTISTSGKVKVNWQWAAAVYTTFDANPTNLGVKPVDANVQNPYLNSDHAGTPENFKSFVTGGQEEAVAAITPGVSARLEALGRVQQVDEGPYAPASPLPSRRASASQCNRRTSSSVSGRHNVFREI